MKQDNLGLVAITCLVLASLFALVRLYDSFNEPSTEKKPFVFVSSNKDYQYYTNGTIVIEVDKKGHVSNVSEHNQDPELKSF